MKSLLGTAILLLAGSLLWGQTQPAPEKKAKHVITEDELVASRPADFEPSVTDASEASPAGEASAKDGEKPADEQPAASQTPALGPNAAADLEALKQKEAELQQELGELEARLAEPSTSEQSASVQSSIDGKREYLELIQRQRQELEKAIAAAGKEQPASAAEGSEAKPAAAQPAAEANPQ
ncbi:MAG TPA: hypothetical protein VLA96_07335 [Terriglobales bacterium]|nr:hypothetical protein [Terriglobales bacterium]